MFFCVPFWHRAGQSFSHSHVALIDVYYGSVQDESLLALLLNKSTHYRTSSDYCYAIIVKLQIKPIDALSDLEETSVHQNLSGK